MDMIKQKEVEIEVSKPKKPFWSRIGKEPKRLKIESIDNSPKNEEKKKSALVYGLGILSCWALSFGSGLGIAASTIIIATGIVTLPVFSIAVGVGGITACLLATYSLMKTSVNLAEKMTDRISENRESAKTLTK